MRCKKCNGTSRVRDSRPSSLHVRRRRVCESCGYRWSTIEIPTNVNVSILKEILKEMQQSLAGTEARTNKRLRFVEGELVRLSDALEEIAVVPKRHASDGEL